MVNDRSVSSRRGGNRRRFLTSAAGVAATALTAPLIARISPALAAYPDKPIKLLVPFGPGGPVDVAARMMGPPLSELLGVPVVVENRPGASGSLGAGIAARSEPDGYTVLVQASSIVTNPLLFTSVPYNPETDFSPVIDLADTPTAFAVNPKLGIRTLKEFVEAAKEKGNFNFSHPGFGTVSHLTGELFRIRTGINLAAVPHNGGGPATQSLLSGSVELCSAALPALQSLVQAGSVVGIGLTSPKRWPGMPNLPTFEESGFPDFTLANFTALFVPSKTPPEITDRLYKSSLVVLDSPGFREKLRLVGLDVTAGSPASLKARIERETKIWREVATRAGMKPIEPK
jgi:tripartite-type tricarboxylate transporter receptor subunit TctC